nr:helix-turn-helix transcriptional regulator [Mesorhizobium sp. L48C026A00]
MQRFRQKNHLTQEQLAEISGFSQQYISGLEKGRRNPTIVTIYEFAHGTRAARQTGLRVPQRPGLFRSG